MQSALEREKETLYRLLMRLADMYQVADDARQDVIRAEFKLHASRFKRICNCPGRRQILQELEQWLQLEPDRRSRLPPWEMPFQDGQKSAG